jgi:hypothetical protein
LLVRHFAVFALVGSALLTACGDSTGFRIDPVLVTDTVEIATPTSQNVDLPTALDITSPDNGATIRGGRFPEQASDAGEFDFALRARGGELVLVPAGALGLQSRASITRALPNTTFAGLVEAPGRTSFVSDSAVALQVGSVYAARSRLISGGFGGSCEQFAKLQPLAIDPALGRVRLLITTNARCSDPRLALED